MAWLASGSVKRRRIKYRSSAWEAERGGGGLTLGSGADVSTAAAAPPRANRRASERGGRVSGTVSGSMGGGTPAALAHNVLADGGECAGRQGR